MENEKFGEVKTRKNIFPSLARDIVNKGSIRILITQAKVSPAVKAILDEGRVVLYEGVEPAEVDRIREVIAKELEKSEKKETE